MQLPAREYLLLTGPVEAAADTGEIAGNGQMPNLWWPADHAWCVASEIDLSSTYIGGSRALVERLCADKCIEALEAHPEDDRWHAEDWLVEQAEAAVGRVLAEGRTEVATSGGTVGVTLQRLTVDEPGAVSTSRLSVHGSNGSGWYRLIDEDLASLKGEIGLGRDPGVVDLVGRETSVAASLFGPSSPVLVFPLGGTADAHRCSALHMALGVWTYPQGQADPALY